MLPNGKYFNFSTLFCAFKIMENNGSGLGAVVKIEAQFFNFAQKFN